MTAAPDLLGAIVAATERINEVRREREPAAALEKRSAAASPAATASIKNATDSGGDRIVHTKQYPRSAPHSSSPVVPTTSAARLDLPVWMSPSKKYAGERIIR